jgi:hypothetical protein
LWSANVGTVAGAWWFGLFPTELEGWVRLFMVPAELSWWEVIGRSLILLGVVLGVGAAVMDLFARLAPREKINNR